MTESTASMVAHLIGFLTGIALYAMLMIRPPHARSVRDRSSVAMSSSLLARYLGRSAAVSAVGEDPAASAANAE